MYSAHNCMRELRISLRLGFNPLSSHAYLRRLSSFSYLFDLSLFPSFHSFFMSVASDVSSVNFSSIISNVVLMMHKPVEEIYLYMYISIGLKTIKSNHHDAVDFTEIV